MDTKQLKVLSSTGLTVLMVLFQNFQFMPEDLMGLNPVDNIQRSEHAKELLGKKYKKSPAAQTEQLSNLHFKLYQEVRKQLPAQHRPHAFRITRAILNESSKFNFDPIFVAAIIKTESSYNPLAIGGVGEIGLMQLRPETAKWMAEKANIPYNDHLELKDPVKNIKIGVAYMDYLREKFPAKSYRYIAAYNMGPKNVRRLLAQDKKPKEYPERIYNNYNETYKRLVKDSVIKTDQVISQISGTNSNVY